MCGIPRLTDFTVCKFILNVYIFHNIYITWKRSNEVSHLNVFCRNWMETRQTDKKFSCLLRIANFLNLLLLLIITYY